MLETRENMDQMLQQVRDYVFQTDEALKASQRSFCRDGQLETIALKEIRDDIWALEDKVRACKWATSAAEQAELANQIDPLMLQVLAKCQEHQDQVKACQGLLGDIVTWCERGTSAYRFTVHESAVSKASSTRYSAAQGQNDAALQGRNIPASRIPAYMSPPKQARAAARQQQLQPQQQQQPLLQVKAQSRIPQPQVTRKSLPDAEQQCSAQDQEGRERSSSSSDSPEAATDTTSTESRVSSSAARFGGSVRSTPPAPAGAAPRSSGLVAAAAAAFEVVRVGPASAPVPADVFEPLDLDAEDDGGDGQLLTAAAVQSIVPQEHQQRQADVVTSAAVRPHQETLSHSSSSRGGSGTVFSSLQSRGSVGRVPRSLLQLEPSRDDVPLTSAGQRMQSTVAAGDAASSAAVAAPAAPAVAHPAANMAAAAGSLGAGMRFSGSLQTDPGRLLQLKVPRPGYVADAPPADPGSASDFSDFGPLHSFTPMVGQQLGRSTNPFAASGGYLNDRSSLRTSQDISLLLRSGMLVEAALLSSNASRMHVIHDAVAKKPAKPDGEPEVPVVPARLAVHKRRPWWAQAARVVVGTAAMAVAGAAGAAAASKHHQVGDAQSAGNDQGLQGLLRPLRGQRSSKDGRQQRQLQQQQQALEEATHQLPFVPMGPAPDASAGCG